MITQNTTKLQSLMHSHCCLCVFQCQIIVNQQTKAQLKGHTKVKVLLSYVSGDSVKVFCPRSSILFYIIQLTYQTIK